MFGMSTCESLTSRSIGFIATCNDSGFEIGACHYGFLFRVTVDSKKEIFDLEIVRLHGIPFSIISDHDLRFTFRFWGKFHEALGSRLNFSITFHMQTDGQSE
ncbi:Transposon Ty3-I Gag-Pol polyprotein [Gossypium australe]|uniref:Transposon Ty3-I Gag-Pol polyprotein n=1 Tax=Gossypium australe TaxID=47621 RepID=A0A5B6VLP1_9ROSI|nr:Transposon Ty3-I Gag-Pol polyprotein [Gossypium australe]